MAIFPLPAAITRLSMARNTSPTNALWRSARARLLSAHRPSSPGGRGKGSPRQLTWVTATSVVHLQRSSQRRGVQKRLGELKPSVWSEGRQGVTMALAQ